MGYPKLTPITATGGTAPRYLADRFADFVNVKDFGAKGDGATDDTAAFEAAAATGKPVFVPDGSYILTEEVSGTFFGTSGAKTSVPLDMACITERRTRASCLDRQGTHLFELPYDKANNVTNWGRAIQGFCYDKFSNVLYCTAAYHVNSEAQAEFVYAFDYRDKTLLGTNYNANATYRGAFFDRFSHQNMAIYRQSAEDEPLFFSSGPTYSAPNVSNTANSNKLRLLSWDYTNPSECTIVKEWTMFDASIYTPVTADVCVSEDGSTLCAVSLRTSDNVRVVGVWNIEDILSATGNIYSLARNVLVSPWGSLSIGGQSMTCDSDYIYALRSGATAGTPHNLFGIDIRSGRKAFFRAASWEGYELPVEGITGVESEAINFLPVNSCMHLCLASTVTGTSYRCANFYDLESPGLPLDTGVPVRHGAGTSGTSADFDNVTDINLYLSSGAMSDLSDGSWLLETKKVTESGSTRFQIAYRGNTATDVRRRLYSSGSWTRWIKYLFFYGRGVYGTELPLLGENDNHSFFFNWMSKRDEYDQSCCFIDRYRSNDDQGASSSNVIYIGAQENTYYFTRLGLSTTYTVSGSSVSATFILYPSCKTEGGKSATFTKNIGSISYPWDNAYIASGQISTSDVRLKDNIEVPSDALMRAWGKVNFKVFQMKDALQAKGENARIHVGVIAQEVHDAFASEGLDAGRYGLFCYDRWEDKYDDVDIIDEPAVYDEDGKELSPAKTHTEKQLIEHSGDKYSIRYEEALALECAYQRWRLEQLEERVNQLTSISNK